MKNHVYKLRSAHVTVSSGLLAMVSACGGGGGSPGIQTTDLSATVNLSTVSAVSVVKPLMYGKPAVFAVTGTHLDQGLKVSGTGCSSPVLMSAPPAANTSTTAYYQCAGLTVGTGSFAVARSGDGVMLNTTPFTVPMPQVTLTLSIGADVNETFVITLRADKMPLTVNNFLDYVNKGFYEDTLMNAVAFAAPSGGLLPVPITIQGGGAVAAGDSLALKSTPFDPIALELNNGLSNTELTVSMTYNRNLGSGNLITSQFFINIVDNSEAFDSKTIFSNGYPVFGIVSGGKDTVKRMLAAPCISNALFQDGCTPTPYIVITKAKQTL